MCYGCKYTDFEKSTRRGAFRRRPSTVAWSSVFASTLHIFDVLTLGSPYSLLWAVSLAKNDYQSFFASLPVIEPAASSRFKARVAPPERKKHPLGCFSFWRRHPDLNRGITVLQTVALPLGYDAV